MNRTTSTDNIQEESQSGKEACRAQGHLNCRPHEQGCAPHVLRVGRTSWPYGGKVGSLLSETKNLAGNVTNMTRKPVGPTCGHCRTFPEKNGNPACQWVLGPEAFPHPCLTKYDCRVREGSDVSHGEGARGHGAWAGTGRRRRLLR